MKIAISFVLALAVCFGQSASRDALHVGSGVTLFTTAGVAVQVPSTGVFSLGAAKSIGKSQDVFVDVSISPNTTGGFSTVAIAGMTKSLPFNATFTLFKKRIIISPYAIVGYGTTLADSSRLSGKKVNLSTNTAFTQVYGGAFKLLSLKYADLSLGAKYSTAGDAQSFVYPFVMFSKTF